ncbi:MAG: hypothetical protein JWM11_2307 [Planctomycetaceae bacterium]|nr:hypothetical protein [Planctomycetaceae bacterium]
MNNFGSNTTRLGLGGDAMHRLIRDEIGVMPSGGASNPIPGRYQ